MVGTRSPLGVNVPLRFVPKKSERQSKKAGGGKDNRAGGDNGKNGGDRAQKEVGTHNGATDEDMRRDGGQSGGGMADSGVDCRHRRGHTCVVSPTRVAVPDKLFAAASVAAATVWTAAAAAVKHEHATKNYQRALIELISRIVRCSKTFMRIFQF